MNLSEKPIEAATLELLEGCTRDGAALLGVDPLTNQTSEIVAAIDACVLGLQQGQGIQFEEEDDAPLLLGSLWGQQLVAEFKWEWGKVVFHDQQDIEAMGVFSQNRALAIYPFHFVYGCITNHAPVTILLAFNILRDKSRVPELPAGGFENVMDNVHHVVPRE